MYGRERPRGARLPRIIRSPIVAMSRASMLLVCRVLTRALSNASSATHLVIYNEHGLSIVVYFCYLLIDLYFCKNAGVFRELNPGPLAP